MRRLLTYVLAATAATTLAVAPPAVGSAGVGGDPAPEAPGASTGDGFSVSVRFSGDAAPGGDRGTVRTVRVAAKCWWEHAETPYDDAKLFLSHYYSVQGSTVGDEVKGMYGPEDRYIAAAEQTTVERPLWWFRATCRNLDDLAAYTGETFLFRGRRLAITYRAFPVVNGNAALPAPLIAPQALAEAARDVMVLPLPTVDRNPKATNPGLTGATLVNLPTWFWVTNPAAVGNPTGTRTIRAQVADGTI